jgi:hypothetical protein
MKYKEMRVFEFLVIYDRDILNNERILECLVSFKGDVLKYKEILEYLEIYKIIEILDSFADKITGKKTQ